MYEAIRDPYCYAGSSVLKNRLKIKNHQSLAEAEAILAQQRIMELYIYQPVNGRFGLAHLCQIHRYIFQDVYPWAGSLRTVRITKGLSTFCYPENIKAESERIFSQLKTENYLRGLNHSDFLNRIAWYIGEINALHPFREGNGRALRIFLWFLGNQAGWEIRFESVEPAEWLTACIAAHNADYIPLITLLSPIVDKLEE